MARRPTVLAAFIAAGLLMSCILGALPFQCGLSGASTAFAAVDEDTGANQRSNYWRAVRQGASGTTTVQTPEAGVLIHNGGHNWRQVRNGLLANISPWAIAGVVLAIGVFFLVFGPQRLEEEDDGETILRWRLWERVLHWFTALMFVSLVITGFTLLLGRALLIPLLGHEAFAELAALFKLGHNYAGPLFTVGVLIELLAWFKDNIPTKVDLEWIRLGGGLTGKSHPHAGKNNAGAKAWFWIVASVGLAVCITGGVLDFPNFGQTRTVMQVAHVLHVALVTLFVMASLGHIYMGTIGAEGTLQGMVSGRVSGAWARQHQDLWYRDVKSSPRAPGSELAAGG
jgi:formate dehydrogenase subunit gamma